MVPPTEPCALRSTQPLKVSTRDFSWGKGGRCVWLTIYHPCSAEMSRKIWGLNLPGTPWATSACCEKPLPLLKQRFLLPKLVYQHMYQTISTYKYILYQNNTYIHAYLLTPWSRVLLEKLIGSAASQEIPRIFGTRRFITSARHLS